MSTRLRLLGIALIAMLPASFLAPSSTTAQSANGNSGCSGNSTVFVSGYITNTDTVNLNVRLNTTE